MKKLSQLSLLEVKKFLQKKGFKISYKKDNKFCVIKRF